MNKQNTAGICSLFGLTLLLSVAAPTLAQRSAPGGPPPIDKRTNAAHATAGPVLARMATAELRQSSGDEGSTATRSADGADRRRLQSHAVAAQRDRSRHRLSQTA